MGQGSQKTPNRSRDPRGIKFYKKKAKRCNIYWFCAYYSMHTIHKPHFITPHETVKNHQTGHKQRDRIPG